MGKNTVPNPAKMGKPIILQTFLIFKLAPGGMSSLGLLVTENEEKVKTKIL